jgi:hypothetical protein
MTVEEAAVEMETILIRLCAIRHQGHPTDLFLEATATALNKIGDCLDLPAQILYYGLAKQVENLRSQCSNKA